MMIVDMAAATINLCFLVDRKTDPVRSKETIGISVATQLVILIAYPLLFLKLWTGLFTGVDEGWTMIVLLKETGVFYLLFLVVGVIAAQNPIGFKRQKR